LKAIDAEVKRIRTEPVTQQELETAKQTVLNSFVFNFDTRAKTLNRLLTYRYFGYPDDFIFQYQKAVGNVTAADILRVAKEHIDPAKFVIVAVGNPKDFGTPLTSLGVPVHEIDLTIPEPKADAAPANSETIARGRALLAKVRDAMGGADKIAAIKDVTQTSSIQLDPARGALKITQTEQWLAPVHFREENVMPFGKVSTYFDGKTGWAATPQGTGPLPEAQQKQSGAASFRIWFPLLLSDRDAGRTVVETADGKLAISDQEGHSVTLTIDPKTNLPATETFVEPGGNGPIEEVYGDWQEINGIKLPRNITLNEGGKHFADVTVTDVKVNQGLTVEQLSKKP